MVDEGENMTKEQESLARLKKIGVAAAMAVLICIVAIPFYLFSVAVAVAIMGVLLGLITCEYLWCKYI